jgi:hypothetical protein
VGVDGRREIRELVHDDRRPPDSEGLPETRPVEDVTHDRVGAEGLQVTDLLGRPRHRHDVVTALDEQWHEKPADHARGSGDEHSHDVNARTGTRDGTL